MRSCLCKGVCVIKRPFVSDCSLYCHSIRISNSTGGTWAAENPLPPHLIQWAPRFPYKLRTIDFCNKGSFDSRHQFLQNLHVVRLFINPLAHLHYNYAIMYSIHSEYRTTCELSQTRIRAILFLDHTLEAIVDIHANNGSNLWPRSKMLSSDIKRCVKFSQS